MKTQIGIVGAGPAGLLLSHLLHLEGIESVILENRSREYVENRVRAGVLEQGAVDILNESGVGERMRREGMVHHGFNILVGGHRRRIALDELTGGKCITVYGQQEVVKDLIARRLADGGVILFEVADVEVRDIDGSHPRILCRHEGREETLECDFIAGCDGFHGICRPSIPEHVLRCYDRIYTFAWLGILAEAAPAQHELIYSLHERGFALFSMRSPSITRLYVQCPPDDNIDDWSDDRIWDELSVRLRDENGWQPNIGPILQKGISPMRSFVSEPMRHGNLFLAGDAAHIVPATGAKGMNLAMADVRLLSRAFASWYAKNDSTGLEAYSDTTLRRVWKVERFSWHMSSMLHNHPEHDAFRRKVQLSELDYYTDSHAGRMVIAENYVGLPFDD